MKNVTQVEQDLAAVDTLLKEAAEPAKPAARADDAAGALVPEKAKRPGVYDPRAGHRVMPRPKSKPEVELDEDGALPDLNGATANVPEAPRLRVPLDGFPGVEDDADVIACRANHARIAADLRAVCARRAAIEKELGVPAGASARTLERIGVQLIVQGGDDSKVEELKQLGDREKRLRSACELAAKRVLELLDEACRKLSGRAAAELFEPAAVAEARAALAYLAAREASQQAGERLRAAGLGQAINPNLADLDGTTRGQNVWLADAVHCGRLKREEVRAALPHIQGI